MPLFEAAPRQFYIATQNWQRVFFAGYNQINGVVVLDLVEPKKTRGVFVHLIGTARTHWTETETYTNDKGESKTRTVTYSDSAEIVHLRTAVWLPPSGLESDLLPPGTYSLPFSFTTPPNQVLPPNFDSTDGKITYTLKANIDRPWKWDHRTFLPITLLPVVDCNDPRYAVELNRQDEKTMCCCCCASGPIIATVRSPASAWCPGECVPFMVRIENHTKSEMSDISCAIDCETTCYAGHRSRSESKRLAEEKLGRPVPPNSDTTETLYVRVPSCCPSFSRQAGRIIAHEYWLHLTVHLPAGSFNMHLRMPVVMGTIPHMRPPLFREQMGEQQQMPVYDWASAERIAQAAAQAAAQATAPPVPSEYQDAYTESTDPDVSTLGGKTEYVYFEMPKSNMQATVTVHALGGGDERAPLLHSATTTKTSSFQAGGMTGTMTVHATATGAGSAEDAAEAAAAAADATADATAAVAGATADMANMFGNMFAPPAAVYDIPPERRR